MNNNFIKIYDSWQIPLENNKEYDYFICFL